MGKHTQWITEDDLLDVDKEQQTMANDKSTKGGNFVKKDGAPALKVQVPADLKKASKKGTVK